MSDPISPEARERYHPAVSDDGTFIGGERDYEGRLSIIQGEVDFHGRRVLDLGCSGGFFSFALAGTADRVVGVDADRHIIEKNRLAARRIGADNLEFRVGTIGPELFGALPDFDVVLCMSVMHHLIAQSNTYAWDRPMDAERTEQVLAGIRDLGNVLVFEMGHVDEGFDWCGQLNEEVRDPERWILERVFGPEFETVRRLRGPGYATWPLRRWPGLRRLLLPSSVGRKALDIMGVDVRDLRDIYIGSKRSGRRLEPAG